MKRIHAVLIIVALFTGVSLAKLGPEQYYYINEDKLNPPDEVKSLLDNATRTDELTDLLQSPDIYIRAAAVRRIGEIDGKEAITLLLETFYSQPDKRLPTSLPVVRVEVVRTLSRINATKELAKLMNDLWTNKRPQDLGSPDPVWRKDTYVVIHHLLQQANKHSSDPDVFKAINEIVQTDGLAEKFAPYKYSIVYWGWMGYIRCAMAQDNLTTPAEQVNFLMGFAEESKNTDQSDVLIKVKTGAVRQILDATKTEDLIQALADIQQDINVLQADPFADANYVETLLRHANSLNNIIYIREFERLRAEAAAKTDN